MFLKLGLGLFCATLVAGCYRHTFTVGAGGNTNKTPEYSAWQSHYFYGLIGESDIDVKSICPSGNATIQDKQSFLNSVVYSLIGIIYAPTTVEIYCGDGSTAKLTVTPQQLQAAGMSPEMMEMAREISAAKAAELQSAIDTFRESQRNVARNGSPSRL
jgi:hypothetical protein